MSSDPAPSPRDPLLAQLLRERFGMPDEVAREVTGAAGPPPEYVRPPAGSGRYADEHARIQRRLATALPDYPQQLALIGNGGVAHVLVSRSPARGETLCGAIGVAFTAGDDIPVCRKCAIA